MKYKKFSKSLTGKEIVEVHLIGETLDSVTFDTTLRGELKSVLLEIDHCYLYGTLKDVIYEQRVSDKINYYKIFKEVTEDASEQNFIRFYIDFVSTMYYYQIV